MRTESRGWGYDDNHYIPGAQSWRNAAANSMLGTKAGLVPGKGT